MNTLLLQKLGSRRLSREETLLYQEVHLCRRLPVRYATIKELRRGHDRPRPGEVPAGTVEFIHDCLHSLGIPLPPVHYYPEALSPWLHRRIWKCSLKSALSNLEQSGQPVFLKPSTRLKAFTGLVLRSPEDFQCAVGRNLSVLCSDPVNWVVEWRVYVVGGKIRVISPYSGHESLPIPRSAIEEMVETLVGAGWHMANFVLDAGLLDTGNLALVEVNDGYAVGAYDVSAGDYLELIESRWAELNDSRTSLPEPKEI